MSDKLTRAFEGARSNPFALRHLQLCHSVGEVSRTPGPKVVLASFPDLEAGFARDLFLLWAPNPQNSIVLTARYVFAIIDHPSLSQVCHLFCSVFVGWQPYNKGNK